MVSLAIATRGSALKPTISLAEAVMLSLTLFISLQRYQVGAISLCARERNLTMCDELEDSPRFK